jgi:demethoxyubiquinone hydroxylase (CLK1/Coq7/Cat5 family)/predicted DCC family thiol-disulfide oxidoreductase YuxK
VKSAESPEVLKVLFDGGCPLCRREIAHVKGLAEKHQESALCFVDVSDAASAGPTYAHDRAQLLARFHVERADGSRLDGAAAFIAMWRRLPGWRWLARIAQLPGMPFLFEVAYRGFLRVRPTMQRIAVHLEKTSPPVPVTANIPTNEPVKHTLQSTTDGTANVAANLPIHLLRELRSDHAGETGAVYIYRGIVAVARLRGYPELISFAQSHGETESEHLRLIEDWLSPQLRSRLLGPWRLAGWLTGALPALLGPRAVYATIAAVETFVDQHYQQQIDYLNQYGGPEGLLELLKRCQADECHHRDEAAELAGASASWILRAWCALVGSGSATAVKIARRW